MDFLGIIKVETRKYSSAQSRLTRRKGERGKILMSRWREVREGARVDTLKWSSNWRPKRQVPEGKRKWSVSVSDRVMGQWNTSKVRRKPCWSSHQHWPELAIGDTRGSREAVGMSHHSHFRNLCKKREQTRPVAGWAAVALLQTGRTLMAPEKPRTQLHITPSRVILHPRGTSWTSSPGTARKNWSHLSARQLSSTWQTLLFITAVLVKTLAISSAIQHGSDWLLVSWMNFRISEFLYF